MADDFEWQTDIESGWDEPALKPVPKRGYLSRRTRVILVTLALSIVIGSVIWTYVTLNRRVNEATSSAQSDVLLAHELLASGALRADVEVVEGLIARRPSSWQSLQVELLSKHLFYGRRPLGIVPSHVDAPDDAMISLARISPDMTEGEVVDQRLYLVHVGNGITETVTLERRFIYQKLDEQWLLAPPDERNFWGNWAHDERSRLTLTFPVRDQEVAVRLAGDLDRFLTELCLAQTMSCPDGFHLSLKLERDPTSLRRLGEGYYPIGAGTASDNRLSLPAPSLVGRPVDEAGYQALRRGYAGWIGAAIVSSFGTQEGPTTPNVLAAVLADFGLSPPLEPILPLPRPTRIDFPPEIPAPQQDVLMLCAERSSLRLLRFQPASGRWQEELPPGQLPGATLQGARSMPVLGRLPDYQGAIIQTASDDDEQTLWQSFLWQSDELKLLTEDARVHYYLPSWMQPRYQPAHRYLTFYVPGEYTDSQQFGALAVDLQECETQPCELYPLSGMPFWSPDGRHTVIVAPGPNGYLTLHVGDESGNVIRRISAGQSVAWLDDERFTYVNLESDAERDEFGRLFGQRVTLESVGTEHHEAVQSETLFDAEMIRQLIQDTNRPDALGLWTAQPVLGSWWFVGASSLDEGDQRDFMFVYDPRTGEATLATDLGSLRLVETPIVSPQGRYVVVVGLAADRGEVSVELIDTQTGEMRRLQGFFGSDWSEDEAWLMQTENRTLHFIATSTGQEWPVTHDLQACYWAVWSD